MKNENVTQKIILVWDFVEKYYPKYYQCDDIAENDDLTKIIAGELNGQALEMYNEELSDRRSYWGGAIEDAEVENDVTERFKQRLNESNAFIYERAIEGYLDTLKN